MINFQSSLRVVPDLLKNVSLVVLVGSDSNSHTVFTLSDTCVHTYPSQYTCRESGRAKEIKKLEFY
jgi:hypothetical protein